MSPMRTVTAFAYVATKDFSLDGATEIVLVHAFDVRHAAQILQSHVDGAKHEPHVIHLGPYSVRKVSIRVALGVSR